MGCWSNNLTALDVNVLDSSMEMSSGNLMAVLKETCTDRNFDGDTLGNVSSFDAIGLLEGETLGLLDGEAVGVGGRWGEIVRLVDGETLGLFDGEAVGVGVP